MRVLMLGGNGYIGSLFYNNFNDVYDITSIDLCLFGKDLGYSQKINYARLDKKTIKDSDVILCLAAHSSVQMAECDFRRSWKNNVEYFIELCENIDLDQKLIYASSASVYGKTNDLCKEDSLINCNSINNYDLQKTTIDLIANRYINLGKNIIGLRFGTVNGISPNTRNDLMLNSMVISALQTGKINVKNSHIKRAILGINDAAKIISKIIDTKINPGQYNLSSFNGTVHDYCSAVQKATGAEIVKLPDDKNAYDFMLDTSKILNSLDFVFGDTPQSLILDLQKHINSIAIDNRSNDRFFESCL